MPPPTFDLYCPGWIIRRSTAQSAACQSASSGHGFSGRLTNTVLVPPPGRNPGQSGKSPTITIALGDTSQAAAVSAGRLGRAWAAHHRAPAHPRRQSSPPGQSLPTSHAPAPAHCGSGCPGDNPARPIPAPVPPSLAPATEPSASSRSCSSNQACLAAATSAGNAARWVRMSSSGGISSATRMAAKSCTATVRVPSMSNTQCLICARLMPSPYGGGSGLPE